MEGNVGGGGIHISTTADFKENQILFYFLYFNGNESPQGKDIYIYDSTNKKYNKSPFEHSFSSTGDNRVLHYNGSGGGYHNDWLEDGTLNRFAYKKLNKLLTVVNYSFFFVVVE